MVIFPVHDHGPRPSACLLGLPSRRPREQKTPLLSHVQRVQTRKVPPLFRLQQVRAQHGPPLSLDQQLHRLLEPQVLPAVAGIRVLDHLLRCHHHVLRLCHVYQMGNRCVLPIEGIERSANAFPFFTSLTMLHSGLSDCGVDDFLPEVPHIPGDIKQDDYREPGQEGQALQIGV